MSEYGTGLVYPLVLFAKHIGRIREQLESYQKIGFPDDAYEMWFNGAGDHFYEIKVPTPWADKELGRRLVELQDKVLHWRLAWDGRPKATKEDFLWACEEIEALAQLIDKELGVESEEADYN